MLWVGETEARLVVLLHYIDGREKQRMSRSRNGWKYKNKRLPSKIPKGHCQFFFGSGNR